MKPVTVRASTYGGVPENQQQGLDRIVEYLAKALTPGIMLPSTARIVIEWGDEFLLEEIREDAP
ncbi:hypothetical protein LCGC14_2219210 [marine sediment metagenome]|uniref:Uncharacterized protein n=1 Tax=marine sediment metagenome TaxID=412755 RepID=A0A0F9D124_9ZZZZ